MNKLYPNDDGVPTKGIVLHVITDTGAEINISITNDFINIGYVGGEAL